MSLEAIIDELGGAILAILGGSAVIAMLITVLNIVTSF